MRRELADSRLRNPSSSSPNASSPGFGTDSIMEKQFKTVLREKNAEIGRYIAEVQALSAENAHLSSEIEAMTQELEATVYEIDK